MNDSPQASEPVLEFRNVTMSFGDKLVFTEVSFKLRRGETLFLLGPTGSGKSVLLKLALGLFKPDSGDILVEGNNIVPLAEADLDPIRRRMGILFQEGALFDSLSVYENVSYRLHEQGEVNETKVERRVREVLSFVEMEEAIDKMPSELSGGMRRRVAIARAIINQPCFMFYDSPTGGLDPITAHTINVLITKLRDIQHVTSIVVTYLIQTAYVMLNFAYSKKTGGLVPVATNGFGSSPPPASYFMVLRDGKVYFKGDQNQLAASSGDPFLKKMIS